MWGTIDIQKTLPYGSVKDVREEVIGRIKHLAHGGGFIIGPTHHVQIDTPLENFFALCETIKEYGKHPIEL